MSPSPHPAARSTSRRRSALRLPLVAGLSLALAVPVLAACQDESGPARSSASGSASSSAGKSDKSTEPSEKPSKGGKNSNVEYVPSWEFPQSHSGWNVTTYDTDGKNRMEKSNGCVFSATQNLYEPSGEGDRAESDYQADAFIAAYQKPEFTNVSFEPTKDDSTLVKDTDGHPIETRRLDFTYTGTQDNKDYKITRVVRVFSTVGRPVMLQAAYACPVDAYSASEMETLFKATPISNPGPTDMDEGTSDNGTGKGSKSEDKKSGSEDKKSDEKSSGSSPKDT